MDEPRQRTTGLEISAGVFFGGLALVIVVAFWPVVLTLVGIGLVGFGLLWVYVMLRTSPKLRRTVLFIVLVIAVLIGLAVWLNRQ